MKELFEKQVKKAKTASVVLAVIFAIYLIVSLAIIAAISFDTAAILVFLFAYVFIVAFIIWLAKYRPVLSTKKYLEKRNLEYVLDDIDISAPVLPQTKIYCGSKAIFFKKGFRVIPYSEIAWTYVEVQKLYGLVPLGRIIHINTRDGKQFAIQAVDVEKFKWLLENHILKANPGVIIGFGPQQSARYKEIKKAYKQSMKK